MNLTIENFQQKVDQTIVDRGWRYAQSGKVMNLVENKPGCWSAKVQGTKIYDVTLQQIPPGELSHQCTCPYDWGPICKHIAAVLFLIEGSLSSDEHAESLEIEAGEIRPQLAQLPKSKLVNLFVDLAAWDRQIEALLWSRISAEGQSPFRPAGIDPGINGSCDPDFRPPLRGTDYTPQSLCSSSHPGGTGFNTWQLANRSWCCGTAQPGW